MRFIYSFLFILCAAASAHAQALPYELDADQSTVGFKYMLLGREMNGRMPVESAEIALDFNRPENSRVSAVLRPDKADAGPNYATVAMRGESVLNTDLFPRIFFQSRKITASGTTATVDGDITIRDVTRPIQLEAQFFQQPGSVDGDRSRLSIVLRGEVSRQTFGANGFGGLVSDKIELTILARIARDG